MKKTYLTAFALVLATAAPSSAATLQLTATAKFPWQNSGFSIVFDDADGDMLLSADEVVSFSGYEFFQIDRSYSELLRVSPVPDETDEPLSFTSGGIPITTWLFGEGTNRTAPQPLSFTYTISPVAVPLPASALLLLAGVGGLYGLRRRA